MFYNYLKHEKINIILAEEYKQVFKLKGTRFYNKKIGHVKDCLYYHYPRLSNIQHSAIS